MGRILLVCRLAARDLRRRPAEATLPLLAIMAATTTLTLGLVLQGVTDSPYQSTREATAGPDVVANIGPDPVRSPAADLAGLEALTDAPGVVGHGGPYPVTDAVLQAHGRTVTALAEGRETAPAPIDQPELTQGSWVDDGGVVVEAAFADALDLHAGDPITLDGRPFQVAGVAVTAAALPYPEVSCVGGMCLSGAGLVWLTQADIRSTLVALAAVNAVVITSATVVDNRHSSALARALGATPNEVSAGLSAAHVLPALAGAILGIPGGIGLLAAVDPEGATIPPLWQLLAVVPATALVVATLTTIPARLGARRPAAEILRSELV